mmetsp:Transcript_28274/g.61953  ORF Transcript_28274/g.61953 Transcript_28274/m.61953 type:complete len:249 (+) Transcript_28274:88-834(+)
MVEGAGGGVLPAHAAAEHHRDVAQHAPHVRPHQRAAGPGGPRAPRAAVRGGHLLGGDVAEQHGAVRAGEAPQHARVHHTDQHRAADVELPVLGPGLDVLPEAPGEAVDARDAHRNGRRRRAHQERHEEAVVVAGDARAEHAAVVVEPLEAEGAEGAVAGALRPPDVAAGAVPLGLRVLRGIFRLPAPLLPQPFPDARIRGVYLARLHRSDGGVFMRLRRDQARVGLVGQHQEHQGKDHWHDGDEIPKA